MSLFLVCFLAVQVHNTSVMTKVGEIMQTCMFTRKDSDNSQYTGKHSQLKLGSACFAIYGILPL